MTLVRFSPLLPSYFALDEPIYAFSQERNAIPVYLRSYFIITALMNADPEIHFRVPLRTTTAEMSWQIFTRPPHYGYWKPSSDWPRMRRAGLGVNSSNVNLFMAPCVRSERMNRSNTPRIFLPVLGKMLTGPQTKVEQHTLRVAG